MCVPQSSVVLADITNTVLVKKMKKSPLIKLYQTFKPSEIIIIIIIIARHHANEQQNGAK